ncbi:PEP-CTERM sorting domain-containing protein [Halomicronema sp. CCY15110]|uniref:PEP-CTERM sorting domain-containing protein n=1 Tax=Halomicronema sp. CCY15110 TaxID=2767773 RepID=UPI0019514C43|nr:PEP-CTERM sorting domain-containing protein [Halomicronema sp. CCY15110]
MLKATSLAIAAAAAGTLIAGMPGYAQVDYSQDSFTDGIELNRVGSTSAFELFGTGYVQKGSHLFVGINSNLQLGGQPGSVLGGSIAWGDMFFNFAPDKTFNDALASGDVYGVRFEEKNDSSVSGLGLFKVDSTKSVASQNSGFNSLQAYLNNSVTKNETLGDVFDLNDSSFNYLPKTGGGGASTQSLISTVDGNKLSDVQVLTASELSAEGFDFDSNLGQTGSETYGFKFDISNLPGGSFIAHLWAECFNEGTAFEGEIASVPEPTSALALAVVGGVAWARKRKGSNA